MTDLKKTAQKLAAKGRHGDSMLLHVSPAEVAGLASLIPGGKLPVNPQTGLPEAFFFLPFLASLFGAAAPAAAAATAAAPAAATALGTGAAAAGTAAAGAAGTIGAAGGPLALLGKGIGALGKGIGSLFGFGGGAGTGAGLGTSGTFGMTAPASAGAQAAGYVVPNGGLSSLAGKAGLGLDMTKTASIGGTGATTPAATAATPASALRVIHPPNPTVGTATRVIHPPNPTVGTPVPKLAPAPDKYFLKGSPGPVPDSYFPTTPAAETGKGGLGGLLTMDNALKGMIIAQGLSGLFKKSGGKKDDDDDDEDVKKYDYDQEGATFPDKDYDSGLREWNFYPNSKTRSFANGGIVRLATGGMVPPGGAGVDLQAQMPQDMTFPQNGIGSLISPEQIPESPFPSSQIGAPTEPPPDEAIEPANPNDSELIAQTVEAIQGKIPNPERIMLAFVKVFGEAALQDLIMRVKALGQPNSGQPSNGTSDSIPAMIDGQQPAALSQDEYVVPADVVSGMGNGSTSAGAKQLDDLVGGVRQQRTGSPQPPPNFNAGGLVSLMVR